MSKPQAVVIEDSWTLAELYAMALRADGYETKIFLDGLTAQTWLQSSSPQLVLLDLQLPLVSGQELLQQIRNDVRLAHTVIFVASAHGTLSQYVSVEADLVLNKPVSFAQLRDLAERFRRLFEHQ